MNYGITLTSVLMSVEHLMFELVSVLKDVLYRVVILGFPRPISTRSETHVRGKRERATEPLSRNGDLFDYLVVAPL